MRTPLKGMECVNRTSAIDTAILCDWDVKQKLETLHVTREERSQNVGQILQTGLNSGFGFSYQEMRKVEAKTENVMFTTTVFLCTLIYSYCTLIPCGSKLFFFKYCNKYTLGEKKTINHLIFLALKI